MNSPKEGLEAVPEIFVNGLAVDDLKDSKPDDYYWIEKVPGGGYVFYASVVDVPAVLSKNMLQDQNAKRLLANKYVNDKLVSRILDARFIDENFNPNRNPNLRPQVMVMRITIDESFCFDDEDVFFYTANLRPKGYLTKEEYRGILDGTIQSSDEYTEQLKLWIEVAGQINRKRTQKLPFDVRGVRFADCDSRFNPEFHKVIGEFKYLMRIYATRYMQSVQYGSPAVYLHPDGEKAEFNFVNENGDLTQIQSLQKGIKQKILGMPLFDISPFIIGQGSMVPSMEWTMPVRDYVSITNLRRLFKALSNGTVTQNDWKSLQVFCGELNADIVTAVARAVKN